MNVDNSVDFYALLPSKKFYLPINHYIPDNGFFNIVKKNLINHTEKYTITRDRVFYTCINKTSVSTMPRSGWKIHISSVPDTCNEVLDIVSTYCINNRLNFKFISDKILNSINNNKSAERSSSGKFITIYFSSKNSFVHHIKNLYELLKNFAGPYILTDKRYRDAKSIYYRYGTFIMNDDDLIINPHNSEEYFEDNRELGFNLPTWIEDPFKSNINDVESSSSELFNERFLIEEVIQYTNAGGIYGGLDTLTNESVVIKEARPYTVQFQKDQDAIFLKKNEKNILLNKLNELTFVPDYIDDFYEWEHYYIVEEKKPGITLKQFRATSNPIALPNSSFEDYISYYKRIHYIIEKLLLKVKEIHNKGVIIGDLSFTNVLIDDKDLYFIDFDSSLDVEKNDLQSIFTTINFGHGQLPYNSFIRDYRALGFLIYSLIAPNNGLLDLDATSYKRMLEIFSIRYYLPRSIKNIVEKLIEAEESFTSDSLKDELNKLNLWSLSDRTIQDYVPKNIPDKILTGLIEKIGNGILSTQLTTAVKSNAPMFPNDVKTINHLGLKNGIAGIYYALYNSRLNFDLEFLKEKLLVGLGENQMKSLLNGTAGMIWALTDILSLDNEDVLVEINNLNKYIEKELENKYTNFSFGHGLSGIGCLYLKLYNITNSKYFLLKAISIADKIILSLKDNEKMEKIGLEHGNSGIALFFLYLSDYTKNNRYYDTGKELLKQEIETKTIINNAYMYPKDNSNTNIWYPYFSYGTSGITYVVLKYIKYSYSKNINIDDFEQELEPLVNGLDVDFTAEIGLEKGLSGIFNTLMDLPVNKSQKFMTTMLKNLTTSLIKEKDLIFCPGTGMYRCSTDLATGSAGVLLVLSKYLGSYDGFFKDLEKNW